MKKDNLINRVGKGLAIFAAGTLIGSGICYSKEINSQGYEIPDLSKATLVGEPRYDDLTDRIDGTETRVDKYKTDTKEIYKVSIDNNVFMYGIRDKEAEEYCAIADLDGDGVFETRYSEEELKFTETRTDDKVPNFPAKKDLPPEWVLK